MCEYQLPPEAIMFVDSRHGIFIPYVFFHNIKADCLIWDCDEETKKWILDTCNKQDGCDNDDYWDAWVQAEQCVKVKHPETGNISTIHHDGDVWLIPEEKA